ncbi:DUF2806 domain-containing protein [Klebsiella pneumoniae]|nr:DUF2806 domain-containing protein [Klebsiella pneumoniae]MBD7338359.1 DUF2806 domain-containing protein [Klebsiella pneumoniae]
MGDLSVISMVQKFAKPLYSIVKLTGPFIISQSKTAVENYSNFKLDKARMEAISLLLQEEVKHISADRAKLRDSIINSTGLERVRFQNDYNLLSKEINKLSTIAKVKDFIEEGAEANPSSIISDAWINQFENVAMSLNEKWRQTLLAQAFAMELKNPGSINIASLNCIGSFDELTFMLFGALVDVSIKLGPMSIIPRPDEKEIFHVNQNEYAYNYIAYSLNHLNLLEKDNNLSISIKNPIDLTYGDRTLNIKIKETIPHLRLYVIRFTQLGETLSKLYQKTPTKQGEERFDKFIKLAISYGYDAIEANQKKSN